MIFQKLKKKLERSRGPTVVASSMFTRADSLLAFKQASKTGKGH
jgi:hypothetical protein